MQHAVAVVALAVMMACSSNAAPVDAAGDGQELADGQREQCIAGGTLDFEAFGEPCHAEAFPTLTTCHGGDGWCIDDVCRPMCSAGCPRCASGSYHYSPAGACYCAP